MIKVNNLSKKYGDTYAVKDLSFEVQKGKIYGLLGANGAGKSTTMNMITGYLAPSSGEILIDGYDIKKNPIEAKKRIGYLPEIPPLYLDMTVEEYISFAAELKKIPKLNRKTDIENVITKAKLEAVKGRLIKNLSKGYKQRVGLAQALLGDPEIIILDEPTVGLDPKQIIEVRTLIESLKEQHTVILSSHILSEIESVCDMIMIISKGELKALDTPDNLSKTMKGQMMLTLQLKGSKTEIGNTINSIKSISKVEFLAADTVRIYSDSDIREEIFYTCVKADLPILMMKNDRASLEDIYLELTTADEDEINDDLSDETIADNDEAKIIEGGSDESNI